ncbi:unnamed protein product [Allacma fusca]|uniref:Uncharacterized protein n=1 Tax=Allacma fusca TaxID=39272 RepID=A0A8J2P2F3_9HEXA|nr:unnamed protein product [Allacma fusca]
MLPANGDAGYLRGKYESLILDCNVINSNSHRNNGLSGNHQAGSSSEMTPEPGDDVSSNLPAKITESGDNKSRRPPDTYIYSSG